MSLNINSSGFSNRKDISGKYTKYKMKNLIKKEKIVFCYIQSTSNDKDTLK